MTNYQSGVDALNALNSGGNDSSSNNSFSAFGIGKTYKVRVLGTMDFVTYIGYSIFKKVNTFAAKNPSTRDKKGYAIDNLTAWDLAEKYHRELQFKAIDEKNEAEKKKQGTAASLYKGNSRFIFGYVDLATGDLLAIDASKPQAQEMHAAIMKYEKKLGKLAFELSKTNATGDAKDTKVSLTPLIDFEEDLTPEEQAKFKEFDGRAFDKTRFEGIVYEADETEQIEFLKQAGFDVKLIGLDAPSGTPPTDAPPVDNTQVDIDELPF